MEYTRTNWIGNLVAFAMLWLLSSTSLSAQELIRGKLVKTGVWEGQQVEYLEGEIAVILNSNVGKADVLSLLQSHGATIRKDFDKLSWGLIELPDTVDVLSLAAELKRNPMIEAAEPNMVIRAHIEPDDPYYQDGHQWALKNTGQSPPGGTSDADIDAPEAWNITRGSSSVIIAILDSGIPTDGNDNLTHPDLNDPNKFILGPDYIDLNGANGVKDELGHGTHVTGIAAAETDNDTGIAGVAGNCRVMVIQVFNSTGGSTWDAFYDGVKYAVDNGTDVINFSGGGRSSSPTGELAVNYADSLGVVLIASSGNNNSYIGWPAAYSTSYSNVIAVGATQYNDLRASYSNYGSQLNVVAPGGAHDGGYPVDAGDIYSTMPNYTVTLNGSPYYVSQNYGYLPGTSMAAPHVSGLASLLLSIDPSLTPAQIRTIIEDNADDKGDPGRDDYYGWGRINAYSAVCDVDLAAPTGLYIVNEDEMDEPVELDWDDVAGATSYKVYWRMLYYPGYEPGDWSHIGTTSQSYYTDYAHYVSYLSQHYLEYYVTAVNCGGESDPSYPEACHGDVYKRIVEAEGENIPVAYGLEPNYPNPFNPVTAIRYDLPEASRVSLVIYDIAGREVRSWNLQEQAGYRHVMWDAKDRSGKLVPTGIYIYRFTAISVESDKRFTASRNMLLMK